MPTVYDFKNDGNLDMVMGNKRGGLNFFTQGFGTLSVTDIPVQVDFNLYPNPATDNITIKLNDYPNNNQTIRVIDITGKLLMMEKITSHSTVLDVSQFKKGVYFVTLFSDKGQKTRKLVVQ